MKREALGSIRRNLGNSLVAVAVLWCGALAIGMGALAHHFVDEWLDRSVATTAHLLHEVFSAIPGAWVGEAARTQNLPAPEGMIWQVVSPTGVVIGRSSNAPEQALLDRFEPGYRSLSPEWHVYCLALPSAKAWLLVAQSEGLRDTARTIFSLVAAGLTASLGLVSLFWMNWRVRVEMREIDGLGQVLAMHDPMDIRHDSLPLSRRELVPLAMAVEELAERLAERVRRERALSAHAAHALRTPLSGMRTQLAVAVRDGPESLRPRLKSIEAAASNLGRVVAALVGLFRTQGDVHWAHIDIQQTLDQLPVPGASVVHAKGESLRGDPDLVAAALANLLDNAIKHGASAVTVVADSCQGWQTLKVMDDGHGVPPDRLQQLQAALQAGTAASPMGLGLTLAAEVARFHGGALRVDSPQGGPGGFVVELRWLASAA